MKNMNEKINMEAYQAYYNTNEVNNQNTQPNENAGYIKAKGERTNSNDEIRYPNNEGANTTAAAAANSNANATNTNPADPTGASG